LSQSANYFNYDWFLKGNVGMEIVKAMLEKSGYTVCHYGYEITLLDAMSKRTSRKSNSTTGRRLRSSPDLLVYDDENIMLVEVKSRGKIPPMINISEIRNLKEFWNDAILVVVVPDGNIFYAQRINELEIQQNETFQYYPLTDFEKFQDIFTRVRSEAISHYKEMALLILQRNKTKKETIENTPRAF
jgi:Holliday junction resolvase